MRRSACGPIVQSFITHSSLYPPQIDALYADMRQKAAERTAARK